MPPIETRDLNDYAVLWSAASLDNYGHPKISAPVEIPVRWEDSQTESTGPQDTVQSQPAEVFVDQAIAVGSLMWHGGLADVPVSPTNLCRVTGYNAVSDIKNRFIQQTVTLTRYKNVLPEIAK